MKKIVNSGTLKGEGGFSVRAVEVWRNGVVLPKCYAFWVILIFLFPMALPGLVFALYLVGFVIVLLYYSPMALIFGFDSIFFYAKDPNLEVALPSLWGVGLGIFVYSAIYWFVYWAIRFCRRLGNRFFNYSIGYEKIEKKGGGYAIGSLWKLFWIAVGIIYFLFALVMVYRFARVDSWLFFYLFFMYIGLFLLCLLFYRGANGVGKQLRG